MAQDRLGGFGARRLEAMRKAPTMCLHALPEDRNARRRFTDFLDNPGVSHEEMLVYAGRLTGQRAAGLDVLAISDTSELNFAGHAGRKQGFGKVGNGRDIGLFVHPVIALDATHGGVLGLVDAEMINRPAGPVAHRRSRSAEEKESRRWLSGAESAGTMLAAAASITMVEDREGDTYDQFARRPEAVHLLVRATNAAPWWPCGQARWRCRGRPRRRAACRRGCGCGWSMCARSMRRRRGNRRCIGVC